MSRSGSPFAYRIVETARDLPWLARPLRLAPRVLELAMGRVRLDIEVAHVATLVTEPAIDELIVPPECRRLVQDALARQDGGGPIPLVVGPA